MLCSGRPPRTSLLASDVSSTSPTGTDDPSNPKPPTDNHKPALSSDSAPGTARLKPSGAAAGEFDLSYLDNGGRYAYAGTRAAAAAPDGQQQYVLVFDPARQVLVLHRLDSLFSMNLTRTPANSDPESLRAAHPHLPSAGPPPAETTARDKPADKKTTKTKPAAARAADKKTAGDAPAPKKKPDKEVPPPLPLPPPPEPAAVKVDKAAEKRKKRQQQEEEEEDDDDDDDGGLVIEFPEGRAPPSARRNDFSPAFPTPAVHIRRFSEFARGDGDVDDDDDAAGRDEGDADADGEDDGAFDPGWDPDDEDDDDEARMGDFKLPSPVNHPAAQQQQPAAAPPVDDFDDAELLEEFMDSDSSVSEED